MTKASTTKKEDVSFIFSHTIDLLILSLNKKPLSYKQNDIDLLFKLFCFLILDSNLQMSNLKVQIQKIFEMLIKLYEVNEIETNLYQQLSNLIHVMKSEIGLSYHDDQNEAKQIEFVYKCNNLFHKFYYLITFLKITNSKQLKKIAGNLAYDCLFNLFETILDKKVDFENKEVIKMIYLNNSVYFEFVV